MLARSYKHQLPVRGSYLWLWHENRHSHQTHDGTATVRMSDTWPWEYKHTTAHTLHHAFALTKLDKSWETSESNCLTGKELRRFPRHIEWGDALREMMANRLQRSTGGKQDRSQPEDKHLLTKDCDSPDT